MGMKEYTETGHGREIRQQTVLIHIARKTRTILNWRVNFCWEDFRVNNQQQKQHKRAHANRPSYPCTQNSVTRDPGYWESL